MPISIDLSTVLPLLERAFSFVGVGAFILWGWKFISNYTAKQKELAEIDKEIRATLKEQVTEAKNLYDLERTSLSKQIKHMTETLQKIEAELRTKQMTLSHFEKRMILVGYGMFLTETLAKERANILLEEEEKNCFTAMAALVGQWDPNVALNAVEGLSRIGADPKDDKESLLRLLVKEHQYAMRLAIVAAQCSSVIPTLLNEYESNSSQSLRSVINCIPDKMRSGELDTQIIDQKFLSHDPRDSIKISQAESQS